MGYAKEQIFFTAFIGLIMLRLSKHSESFSATCWSFAPSSTPSLLRFY